MPTLRSIAHAAIVSTAALGAAAAVAAPVQVHVTVESLVPADGISFAPFHVGFHAGTFDAFDLGSPAGAAIISVAEGGTGSAWFPAFAAAEPGATLGTVAAAPLLPGAMLSGSFVVDPALNRFFTFASMAVPSNDFFVGNDDPMEYALFDAAGMLQTATIHVRAGEIWDAGSEAFDPAAAAFVVGGNNDLRTPQNSVVAFDFAELAAFNGLTTAAGYTLNSTLRADDEVLRISFAVQAIPEPGTYALALLGLAAVGIATRRRRTP